MVLAIRYLAAYLLVAVLLSGACSGANPPAESRANNDDLAQRIDLFLSQQADAGFNGSVLIATNDRIILHKGYGWADEQRAKPVTTTTPFWIASISKQFAAAAILKLVEQGRLSLDAPITRFFSNVPPDKRSITVHQLSTHTAGLKQRYAADGITDRDKAIQAVLAHPLARAPGEGFGYSNDAYNLIAAIVEIAAATPYEHYLREQLLEPAGMKHTGFWGPDDHPEVAAILDGNSSDGTPGFGKPSWGYRGGTGMFSTPEDLYRWYVALERDAVLSKPSRQQLLTPHVTRGSLGVGYGWFVSTSARGTSSVWTRGYESFGHGAVLATYPEERVVIAVASSSGERTRDAPVSHWLAEELAALVFDAAPTGP